ECSRGGGFGDEGAPSYGFEGGPLAARVVARGDRHGAPPVVEPIDTCWGTWNGRGCPPASTSRPKAASSMPFCAPLCSTVVSRCGASDGRSRPSQPVIETSSGTDSPASR